MSNFQEDPQPFSSPDSADMTLPENSELRNTRIDNLLKGVGYLEIYKSWIDTAKARGDEDKISRFTGLLAEARMELSDMFEANWESNSDSLNADLAVEFPLLTPTIDENWNISARIEPKDVIGNKDVGGPENMSQLVNLIRMNESWLKEPNLTPERIEFMKKSAYESAEIIAKMLYSPPWNGSIALVVEHHRIFDPTMSNEQLLQIADIIDRYGVLP